MTALLATDQVVMLTSDRLSPQEIDSWERLADRAAEPNPFYTPRFVLPAAKARGEPATLMVVRGEEGWDACLPLRRARGWRSLPLPCLAPWLPEYAYLATPLVDRDAVASGTARLAAALAGARGAAIVVIDPLDPDGPVGAAFIDALEAAGRPPIVYQEFERPTVRRRAEPTYIGGAKRRKEVRRLRRRVEEEFHEEPEVRDRSDDPEAWEAFLDLERSGWKADAGTAMGSREADAAFFREMCREMAAGGRLQILTLEIAGRIAAMQVNLLEGRTLFGFKVAYESDLARFSPGVLLEAASLDVFHEQLPADLIDSCSGPDNELLNRLWPDRRTVQVLLVPTQSPLAFLLRPALAARSVRQALRGSRREAAR